MKLMLAVAAVALIGAACSESILATAPEMELQPRFEFGVQEGRCPPPFTLLYLLIEKDAGIEAGDADANRDGFVCYLETHATDTEVFRTWTDNNVPLSQIGACPNGFELIRIFFETTGHSIDVNRDGWICTRLNGNGSKIEIDNNHRT